MKLLPGLITEQRCKDLIAFSESEGYEPATVTTAQGPKMIPNYRNNERVIHFNQELADELYDLIEPELPQVPGFRHVRLNEMFRFYKYQPGHFFRQHRDGKYVANETEQSFLTFLLYLNGDYEGGETEFETGNRIGDVHEFKPIKPEPGLGCIFHHGLLHKGNEVISGTKYVLRSDVIFTL